MVSSSVSARFLYGFPYRFQRAWTVLCSMKHPLDVVRVGAWNSLTTCLFLLTQSLPMMFIQPFVKNLLTFNILRPRQNAHHFSDNIFKCIFLKENAWISTNISLKFVPKWPINNIPTLVQRMAWRRPGNKPLSEPMVVGLSMYICVTRPQWVKTRDVVRSGANSYRTHDMRITSSLCQNNTVRSFWQCSDIITVWDLIVQKANLMKSYF